MQDIDGLNGSLLVKRGSATALQVSNGAADTEAGTACTPDTRFQIASVSKQFTAAAAMLLVEEGALALGAPIAEWLPGCPRRWRELTLHQLLTHTSGLGHWWELTGFDVTRPGTAEEFLGLFAEVPLRSAPGTAWHYSSPGYLLVAQLIEQVSGRRYADFLDERILLPLGMEATCAGAPPPGGAAHGYQRGRRIDVEAFAAMPGAGDIWSTVGDLARYTSAFNAGRVVSPSSREAMTAAGVPAAGDAGADGPVVIDRYGYGYCLGTLAGRPARFHPGDNPGYHSLLAWLPELDATLVILCNDEDASVDDVLWQILPALTPGP